MLVFTSHTPASGTLCTIAVLQCRGAVNPFLCNHHFPPTFYEKIIPYIYELTMTKYGKKREGKKKFEKSEKNAKKT